MKKDLIVLYSFPLKWEVDEKKVGKMSVSEGLGLMPHHEFLDEASDDDKKITKELGIKNIVYRRNHPLRLENGKEIKLVIFITKKTLFSKKPQMAYVTIRQNEINYHNNGAGDAWENIGNKVYTALKRDAKSKNELTHLLVAIQKT